MSWWLLYLLLLKGVGTSFSGLSSLPVIREDLVVRRHVLTDAQLDAAVAIGRVTPGALGLYVVAVGYEVDGWPGGVAGWLAMTTPALLAIPLIRRAGRVMERHPRARGALDGLALGSAGLLLAATVPLAREALTGWMPAALAAISVGLLLRTRVDPVWVVVGAAGLAAASAALVR